MKIVLAFIQPFKLDAVTRRLERLAHVPGMTVGVARGFGREKSKIVPRGAAEELEDFPEKVRVETVVHDEQVETVVQAIASAAHTGRYGDGMIFVLPVERAVRIMTLREGQEAG